MGDSDHRISSFPSSSSSSLHIKLLFQKTHIKHVNLVDWGCMCEHSSEYVDHLFPIALLRGNYCPLPIVFIVQKVVFDMICMEDGKRRGKEA